MQRRKKAIIYQLLKVSNQQLTLEVVQGNIFVAYAKGLNTHIKNKDHFCLLSYKEAREIFKIRINQRNFHINNGINRNHPFQLYIVRRITDKPKNLGKKNIK